MGRAIVPEEIASQLNWVSRLPDTAWSRSMLEMADALVEELGELKEQRAVLSDKMKARMRVLRQMRARAEREAPLMYEADVVAKAQQEAGGGHEGE
jgi:hypothetical protein